MIVGMPPLDNPEVSIIIPIFNQLAYTKACLRTLWNNTGDAAPYEVIVVDNHSTDGSAEFLQAQQKERSNLRVITLPANQGFASACNRGALEARGQYLVFLNNDTEPQEGWLSEMLKTAGKEKVGVVGSKLIYPQSGLINHAGYVYNPQIGFYPIYHNVSADFAGVNKEREFQAVLGACLLIRKDLFEAAGMFATYGLEDIDLCLKVRRAGYKIMYCPRSRVLHHGSVTLQKSAKDTFPVTSSKEFKRHWPAESLLHDDKEYFRSDGVGFKIEDGNVIALYDQIAPSYEALSRGLKFRTENQWSEAEQHFRQAIQLYPHNVEAYWELICLLLELKKIPQALEACQELVKWEPERHEGYLYLAEIQVKAGLTEQAKITLGRLKELTSLPPKTAARAEELLKKL